MGKGRGGLLVKRQRHCRIAGMALLHLLWNEAKAKAGGLGNIAGRWRHVGGESDSSRQAKKRHSKLGHTVFKCDLSKRTNNQLTEL